MNKREIHEIPHVPKAIGPYSPAVEAGMYIFCSGQIPLDPETGALVAGDFEAQTEQVLKNVSALLKHLRRGPEHIVKSNVFLTDLKNFAAFNKLYEAWTAGARPARTTIGVAALPLGAQVELEVTVLRE